MKKISGLVACLMISLLLSGQGKVTKDYARIKEAVDEKVFGTPDPAFKDNTIPDMYKSESAVILAQKYSLESDSKFKFRFGGSGTSYSFFDIYRKKILINDRAALDEYSQLNFTKMQSRARSLYYSFKNYTFINIRVIKPNGTIKSINVDESAITLKDEKNEKQSKIAIPDLSIGDIVDYYYCNYFVTQGSDTKSLSYVMGDDYPTLNYVISLQFDTRIAVEYQAINGAPDFKISPDQDGGGNVLFMSLKNVPKIKGLVWSSVERQLPIIRVNYSRGAISRANMPDIKQGEVAKSTKEYAVLLEDRMASAVSGQTMMAKSYYKSAASDAKDAWKTYVAKYPKANSPDSIASFVFRYCIWKDFYSNFSLETSYETSYFPLRLSTQIARLTNFIYLMEGEFDQDVDLIVVSGRNSFERDNLLNVDDLSVLIRTHGPKPQYFSFADNLEGPNILPQDLEGEKGKAYELTMGKSLAAVWLTSKKEGSVMITLPSTEYSTNVETETVQVNLDASDPQLLHFKRKVSSTGHFKKNNQANLAVFQDVESHSGYAIGETKDLIARNSDKGKSARKAEEELRTLLDKAKTVQKQSFENEIKQNYDVEPKEVKSFGIKNVGLAANAPFEYEEEFTMDGWVKKAGNNYIVDIGKFIASQVSIDKDQRERTKDIYMPFARAFTYHIEFTAPEGYSIEGLDKLNSKTENKAGAFVTVAKVEGNKLVVDINKFYAHAVEPAANWPMMLSFLDKALEFNQQKILLKKK